MIRTARILPLLLPALLTACGTEKAGTGDAREPASPSVRRAELDALPGRRACA